MASAAEPSSRHSTSWSTRLSSTGSRGRGHTSPSRGSSATGDRSRLAARISVDAGISPRSSSFPWKRKRHGARVCTALSLEAPSLVWNVRRVFLSDGIPLALVSSYLPVASVENLASVDVESSLYAALDRRYGLRPTWASDSYTAVRAQGEVVEQLSVNAGDPVIYSERVAYLRDMRVIEYVQSYIRGDRFAVLLDWLPQESDSESIWYRLNRSDENRGGDS